MALQVKSAAMLTTRLGAQVPALAYEGVSSTQELVAAAYFATRSACCDIPAARVLRDGVSQFLVVDMPTGALRLLRFHYYVEKEEVTYPGKTTPACRGSGWRAEAAVLTFSTPDAAPVRGPKCCSLRIRGAVVAMTELDIMQLHAARALSAPMRSVTQMNALLAEPVPCVTPEYLISAAICAAVAQGASGAPGPPVPAGTSRPPRPPGDSRPPRPPVPPGDSRPPLLGPRPPLFGSLSLPRAVLKTPIAFRAGNASSFDTKRVHNGVEEGDMKRARGESPLSSAWEVHRRERGMWVELRKGEWAQRGPQLAVLLDNVHFDTCEIDDYFCNCERLPVSCGTVMRCHICCYEQWPASAEGMLLLCDTEMARYAATLPFFTRVRKLHVTETMMGSSMSLSACAMLTHVCLTSRCDSDGVIALLRTDRYDLRYTMRTWTAKTAAVLAELPVLRSVRLHFVWDPSLIVTACAPSLESLQFFSCATLEKPMPRLKTLTCDAHFAFLVVSAADAAAVAAALRGCVALRSLYISHTCVRSLFEPVTALRNLEQAILPSTVYFEANEAAHAHAGVVYVRGPGKHGSGEMILLPQLSLLHRLRVLALAQRVTLVGDTTMFTWVVFQAPQRPFKLICTMLLEMSTAGCKYAGCE